MKLFKLRAMANGGGDIINLRDSRGRLSGYFIFNDGDGKFLQHMKLRAEAQENLRAEEILHADFLQCNINIPVFSKKAVEVFVREIPDALEFHSIEIQAGGSGYEYYLTKILTCTNVIDSERSTFLEMNGVDGIIDVPTYRSKFDSIFYIARDSSYPPYIVVSDKFVDLCIENCLNVDFADALQS